MDKKYVVIQEIPDTGFMNCVAICNSEAEAYGKALFALSDGKDPNEYYISLPEYREGECGYIIELFSKKSKTIDETVTILFYDAIKKRKKKERQPIVFWVESEISEVE